MDKELKIDGINDKDILVCISRARTYKLYCIAVNNALEKKCPFCKIDPMINHILIENNSWYAWQSPSPEPNTLYHFILVPKRHVIDTNELDTDEQIDLFQIENGLKKMYNYKSSGFLIRNGDATLSAGTVKHLHAHVLVPNGEGRVEVPIYKGKQSDEKCLLRAIVFEKIRQGEKIKNLTPEEKELIEDRI